MSDIAEATIDREWDYDIASIAVTKFGGCKGFFTIYLRENGAYITLTTKDLQAMLNALEGCEDE